MKKNVMMGFALIVALGMSSCKSGESAYKKALQNAGKEDIIFVGGSTFVVADLLKSNF